MRSVQMDGVRTPTRCCARLITDNTVVPLAPRAGGAVLGHIEFGVFVHR